MPADRRPATAQKWPQTLWVVRHGQSAGNVARDAAEAAACRHRHRRARRRCRRCPRSASGRREALGQWFAEMPADERPQVVLCSPYLRARQTADHVLAVARGDARHGPGAGAKDRRATAREGVRHPRPADPHRHPRQVPRAGRAASRTSASSISGPPGGESWCDVILRLRSFDEMLTREHRKRARADRRPPGHRQLPALPARAARRGADPGDRPCAATCRTAASTPGNSTPRRAGTASWSCGSRTSSCRCARPARRSPRRRTGRQRPSREPARRSGARSTSMQRCCAAGRWPTLDAAADKEARGAILVIAGSRELAGAALLAATACPARRRRQAGRRDRCQRRARSGPGGARGTRCRPAGDPRRWPGGEPASTASSRSSSRPTPLLVGPGLADERATRGFVKGIARTQRRRAVGPRRIGDRCGLLARRLRPAGPADAARRRDGAPDRRVQGERSWPIRSVTRSGWPAS